LSTSIGDARIVRFDISQRVFRNQLQAFGHLVGGSDAATKCFQRFAASCWLLECERVFVIVDVVVARCFQFKSLAEAEVERGPVFVANIIVIADVPIFSFR